MASKTHGALPILVCDVIWRLHLFGRRQLISLITGDVWEDILRGTAILGMIGFIWFAARILRFVGNSLRSGLREGVENWALSFRITALFYGLLLLATFLWVNFQGVNPPMRLQMRLSLIKDYGLLFIIANVLYVGLFKLARARTLYAVFVNNGGFIHFMSLCAIIAVLAVWADFRELDPARTEAIFHSEWQRTWLTYHIFIRDIFLLLLPIALLMVWTLWCLSHEDRRGAKRKKSAEPSVS